MSGLNKVIGGLDGTISFESDAVEFKKGIAQKLARDKSVCYYEQRKTIKNCKIYKNSKKRYQYNRW